MSSAMRSAIQVIVVRFLRLFEVIDELLSLKSTNNKTASIKIVILTPEKRFRRGRLPHRENSFMLYRKNINDVI